MDQTGFVEKPLSESTSEGGKKGNLSAHHPLVSTFVVWFAAQRADGPALLVASSGPFSNCSGSWVLDGTPLEPGSRGRGPEDSSLGSRVSTTWTHVESGGYGSGPGRASDLGSSRQAKPRNLMRM